MQAIRELTSLWLSKIELAEEHREKNFGAAAKEAMKFYGSTDYNFMYKSPVHGNDGGSFIAEGIRSPGFRMQNNKVAEMVDIFLPVLYHRNPERTVQPKFCDIPAELVLASLDPQMQQQVMQAAQMSGMDPMALLYPQRAMQRAQKSIRAKLAEHILNQLPAENNLKQESRATLVEALIKGRGVMWVELIQGNSGLIPVSVHDSVDNLGLDLDSTKLRDAKWCYRKRRRLADDVEKDFGLPVGFVKSSYESGDRKAKISSTGTAEKDRANGKSYDVVEYYELYSRMGIGGNLSGIDENHKAALDGMGHNVFLALVPGMEYPINLPESFWKVERFNEAELEDRVRWHTPFHDDVAHPWPFMNLDFHPVPNCIWPMAHITPAMGELKAINWIDSFMLGHVQNISRDFIVVKKTIDEALKDKILNGPDLTMLEFMGSAGESLDSFVKFLQHPPANQTIFDARAIFERSFEKRTGMTELAYGLGGSTQIRSAKEAEIRDQNVSVRPEDMANQVEDFMGSVAKMELIVAHTHMTEADIAPLLGERYVVPEDTGMGMIPPEVGEYTQLWMQTIGSQPLSEIVSEYTFSVEAGSVRKPNRSAMIDRANEAMQVMAPGAMADYQATGDPQVINYLMTQYYKANDWPDYEQGLFPNRKAEMEAQQQAQMMAQQQQGQPQPGQEGPPPEQQGMPPQ